MACFDRDVSIAFLVLVGLFTPVVLAQAFRDEVDDQSEFTYSVNHSTGPSNWAKLNPNWTACAGRFQSPIDLVDNRVVVLQTLGNLVRHYKPAPAVIKNRGHDISVQWTGDAGGMIINGTLYSLQQCHWHSPSEHTVGGKRYEMEIHLVHKDPRGQIAVVGIMYRLGRSDRFLANLLRNVRTDRNGTMIGGVNETITGSSVDRNGTMRGGVERNGTALGIINPLNIRFTSRQYLRYMGSLTTPPCTEGVLWTVLKAVKTVSRRQMRALRAAVADGFEDNARPIQHYPNPVYMYNPVTTP